MNSVAPIPYDADAQWPAPDMTVVSPERPPAPEMTDDEFGKVFGGFADWINAAASVKNAHPDYVALALLSVASAIIGNTRWVAPWDGWKEPPTIWGMLVGDPSAGKSPALDAILDPVKKIEAELSRQYSQERADWAKRDELAGIVHAQWKSDAKAAHASGSDVPDKPEGADAGPAPVRKRIRITDATTESVAELLATTSRGLLLSRDELSGWIGSMDRYSGGGDRPFWLEAFGGRSYTVDRKQRHDPIIVEHLTVSILGGTQPDKLDSMLVRADDDGLTARFLTAFPNPVPLARPLAGFDTDFLEQALRRLYGITPAKGEHGENRPLLIHLEENAQTALHDFRIQCRVWEGDAAGLMKSHIGKLPGLAVRVSLVLALLDWSINPDADEVTSISAAHIGRACHYVGEHLRLHAFRAYGAASIPPEVKAARQIAEIIKADRISEINTRDIQRKRIKGIQTAKEIGFGVSVLVNAGWLKLRPSQGGGRPPKLYDVNPKLWGKP